MPAETRALGLRLPEGRMLREANWGIEYKADQILTSARGTDETQETGQGSGRRWVSITPSASMVLAGLQASTNLHLTSVVLRAMPGPY